MINHHCKGIELRRIHLVFGENEFAGAFDFDFEDESVGIINNYDVIINTVGGITVEIKVACDKALVEEGVEQLEHVCRADCIQDFLCIRMFYSAATFMLLVFFQPEYQTGVAFIIAPLYSCRDRQSPSE